MRRFLSVHAASYNQFNLQGHLISRRTFRQTRAKAMAGWHQIAAAGNRILAISRATRSYRDNTFVTDIDATLMQKIFDNA